MRKLLVPAVLAGLLGVALQPAPAAAQYYEQDRSEPSGRYGRDAYGDRGLWSDGRERYGTGRYADERFGGERSGRERADREAFDRGYRMGRDDERRRGQSARMGRDGGGSGERQARGEDWNWFSGRDGLFD